MCLLHPTSITFAIHAMHFFALHFLMKFRSITKLRQMGFAVAVQSGAGTLAGFSDAVYVASGATIVSEAEAWNQVQLNILMFTLMSWMILQFLPTVLSYSELCSNVVLRA